LTTPSNPDQLAELLQSVFGFAGFRANQEAVCRAAIAGRDLLLVMPTGFGKSLCYQLPAIALGGTALVISPLIALMEDQAAKLTALGLSVGRIHSGLERAQARQTCVDYLQGNLQFLFIAPERLRVPGFGEMLAKRKPSLIAIDEAHCISQWGHDFRPDYRMIGQYLPALRPAPVVALTATATPAVQADILEQLGTIKPVKFIHGFRRHNLAIEVVELPIPERAGVICGLLADPKRRPAIVYATSRKQAEKLAEELARRIPAAAYHAGLDAETRDRVQTAFQTGELEVVVATIAFGMGIDKADIRTVIHAGLPATLEGYYQEIGRAGRDGKPSRTFLMHSYADQRTHDFFMTRDYPAVEHLQQVYRTLGEEPQPVEELRASSKLGEEEFDKALEKLEIHGGARVDFGGNVTAGGKGWKKSYTVQAQFRAEQFEKVLRFTTSTECRMAALVRHFGDVEDASEQCGICDVCDPAGAVLRLFRRPTAVELGLAQAIADELRAGLIGIEEAEFEKDGKSIRFRKVRLTEAGLEMRATTPVELLISDGVVEEFGGGAPARTKKPKAPAKAGALKAAGTKAAETEPVQLSAEGEALAARLKEWRAVEAKRLGVPVYLVLQNRTLEALAQERPANPRQLLEISGMGPAKVERFGEAILGLCGKGE
jgi:RecQ family ATP-dependent DNA helicase